MMLYHGSPTEGLTRLLPAASALADTKEQLVYLTSLPTAALFYGVRCFEYAYGYNWKDGIPGGLHYIECFPDALRILYSGRAGFLYCCEAEGLAVTQKPNEYVSLQPVDITGCTEIPDLYEAFLKAEREGELEIFRYETLSPKMLLHIEQTAAQIVKEQNLYQADTPFASYMREHYPRAFL